jgi:squalene-hopene/tetraprenyl-beta-curcumene cyclase
LPALIAIGQARHHHAPSGNPLARLVRNATRQKTLKVLGKIQPSSGGFLEATPLTSFVAMSLAGSGQAALPATRHCIEFLMNSAREDGSWPIDTNLATWVTTLSINALGPEAMADLPSSERQQLREWLLAQQYQMTHPYTNAAPGGWAWTDLPGGVPDADDTAGALLALHTLTTPDERTPEFIQKHIVPGIRWLLSLQNSDGGIPTFCRGWTNLAFDRSSPDISAHALRAWGAWLPDVPELNPVLQRGIDRALAYLLKVQRTDGSWIPLWFGNQCDQNDENPIYGTSRVMLGLHEWRERNPACAAGLEQGLRRLLEFQQPDGSFAGALLKDGSINKKAPGTTEETALALEAISKFSNSAATSASARAVEWLSDKLQQEAELTAAPIGFYFARLWYYEKLYPLIFTTAALRSAS